MIVCQAKTANPFSDVALIQDIDVRLGILICNLMDVHKVCKQIFYNEKCLKFLLRCNNIGDSLLLLDGIFRRRRNIVNGLLLDNGNTSTGAAQGSFDLIIHHLTDEVIEGLPKDRTEFFNNILCFWARVAALEEKANKVIRRGIQLFRKDALKFMDVL